jgi:hypothetical protein
MVTGTHRLAASIIAKRKTSWSIKSLKHDPEKLALGLDPGW